MKKPAKKPRRLRSNEILAYAIHQNDPQRDADLASYIRACAPRRAWMDETPQRYAYRCIPMTAANSLGWEILNPYDCKIIWTGGDSVNDLDIQFPANPEVNDGTGGIPKSHFGSGIITWDLPFIFRTPPGVGMVAGGPANMVKDGVSALEGFIETDWLPNGFTMNWKMTRPGHEIYFSAGEPICRVFPYKADYVENFSFSIQNPDSDPAFMQKVIDWRNDRLERLRKKDADPAVDPRNIWSGDYVKGADPSGGSYTSHRNVFKCKQIKDNRGNNN